MKVPNTAMMREMAASYRTLAGMYALDALDAEAQQTAAITLKTALLLEESADYIDASREALATLLTTDLHATTP
jgi:hypothetical protein